MNESGEKLSLIDLIEYYEPGPVLRERTPDLNRTSFHPDEAQHFESDEVPDPGKNITRKAELDLIRKKALGLTDVPIHSTPGNSGAFRKRDEYNEEDFESQFTTGFGGPSELNNFLDIEDKPPTNITRKLKVKFNPDKKEELDKMSFQKTELLKLAKALRHRGQSHFANKVKGIALRKAASLSPAEKQKFMSTWGKGANEDWVIGKVRKDKNQAFVDSCYGEADVGGLTGAGTQEGLMLAALFAKPDEAEVNKKFREQAGVTGGMAGSYGFGKKYSESKIEEIVGSELGGAYLEAAEAIMNGTVNAQNFDPATGKFQEQKAAPSTAPTAPTAPAAAAAGGDSSTQSKTWVDVQKKLNELFTREGVLAGNVEDGMIKGTDVKIPLIVDGDRLGAKSLGPQTTGAFNAATNGSQKDYNWDISADEAYTMLEKAESQDQGDRVTQDEADSDKPAEGAAEEAAEALVSLSSGPVGYMTKEAFEVDFWAAPSPNHDGQIVGVGKADGQYAGLIAVMVTQNVPTSITVNGKKLNPNGDAEFLVFPMKDRGELKGIEGSQALTGREKGALRTVIRNDDKENLKAYRKILGGSTMAERGVSEGFRERGRKRRERGRDRLRNKGKKK